LCNLQKFFFFFIDFLSTIQMMSTTLAKHLHNSCLDASAAIYAMLSVTSAW